MAGKVFEGVIDRWIDRGVAAGYGFISYELGPKIDSVYFEHYDIIPDNLGRRGHCKISGVLVRFELTKHMHRGEAAAKATNVRGVFVPDAPDPDSHREVTTADHIVRGKREPVAAVFLLRNSGDKLYLAPDGVAEPHRDQFQHLEVGRHVWCGVAPPLGNQKSFRAVHAEFYSEVEEADFKERHPC